MKSKIGKENIKKITSWFLEKIKRIVKAPMRMTKEKVRNTNFQYQE